MSKYDIPPEEIARQAKEVREQSIRDLMDGTRRPTSGTRKGVKNKKPAKKRKGK